MHVTELWEAQVQRQSEQNRRLLIYFMEICNVFEGINVHIV